MRSPACSARRRNAAAPVPHPWRRRAATDLLRAVLLLLLIAATPAAAQLGGALTFASEARLRGQPISDHRPVAEVELVHDSRSGFYLGGSAAFVASVDAGLQPLAFKQYAGFAQRLPSGATLDIGLLHSGYTEYSDIAYGGSYTEAYVGLIDRNLSARLSFSPAYFRKDQPTLYLEVDGHLELTRNWLLFAHAGRLSYFNERGSAARGGSVTDWRLGLRRHIGAVDLEAAWTAYVQDRRRYGSSRRIEDSLVVALAVPF